MEFTRADAAHIREAVAMVKHGQTVGTGFFISPGLLLTCEHVVRGAAREAITILWEQRELKPEGVRLPPAEAGLDLAILSVDLRDHPVLEIGPADVAVAPVYSYGFQFNERGYFGYPSLGSIASTAREGTPSAQRELLQIVDAVISPGLSGAPLYSLIDRRVIAVVKRNRPEGGGYAIPIEQLIELQSDLSPLMSNALQKAPQGALERYFRRLSAEHEFVALLDLQRSLRLDDIFVSLTLTRTGAIGRSLSLGVGGGISVSTRTGSTLRTARRDQGSPQRLAADQSISLFDVISYSKAIIIGEPGCGKTTLLRHIVSRTCKGELLRDRIPIFIKLADLSIGIGCVEEFIRTAQLDGSEQLVFALSSGTCALLMDGFDEVPREHYDVLVREIERLAASGNQVMITCRSVSLPRGLFSSEFRIFECIGFNLPQQRRFLRRWFADAPERAGQLEHQISKHTGVLGFARNPLLLSLMSVVAENERDFRLPIHRTALYEKAIRTLLQRRSALSRSHLSVRRKLMILRSIAHKNFTNGREVFGEDDLIGEIEKSSHTQTRLDPEDVLFDFVEVDGVLAAQAPQRYRFLHLTFQEFLTAQSLVESDSYLPIIKEVADDPRWEETIRLVCGLLSPDRAVFVIDSIWTKLSGIKGVERLLLSARAASDCPGLPTLVPRTLATALINATTGSDRPGQTGDAEEALASIARAHDGIIENIVMPAAAANATGPRLSTASLIRVLGLTADTYSADLLRSAWQKISGSDFASDESNQELGGRLLDAIGQAGLNDVDRSIMDALTSSSNYIRGAATRCLIDLQSKATEQRLLEILETGDAQRKELALAVLCSFHDQSLAARLFTRLFSDRLTHLQKSFSYHFNRNEVDLDPGLVEAVWARASDEVTLCHLFTIYRCFLNPVLFSRLKQHALADGAPIASRVSATTTVLRLDAESAPELLQKSVSQFSHGQGDLFKAILAGMPSAKSETLGRQIKTVLTEEQRRREVSSLLRFVFANRVSSLREWVENLGTNDHLSPTVAWRRWLALAALGSPLFLSHASHTLLTLTDVTIPDRIIVYRGLGLTNDERCRALLRTQLELESDQAVVTEIIHALGRQVDLQGVALLLRFLEPQLWPKSWPAPEGPRRQGDQRPADRRRLSVIFALEQCMDREAIPPLAALAADPNEDHSIREAAMIASRNIEWGSGSTAHAYR